jgi:hypothetical protein
MNDKQPKTIPNPLWCDRCEGCGYVIYDSEWEPYAVECDACKDRRPAKEAVPLTGNNGERDEKREYQSMTVLIFP